jgi:hypothetical protein
VSNFTDQVRDGMLQQSGDPVAAQQVALQSLENLRTQQALSPLLLRLFPRLRDPCRYSCLSGPPDETLGDRKRGAHSGGVVRCLSILKY